MTDKLIRYCLENRFVVLAIFLIIAAIGVWATITIPVDAIPDLTDVQVILLTDWPGQNPQVIEDQVTYPLSTAMLNVARVKDVRTKTLFGVSFVYVIFEDGTDLYWARSRVLEYLSSVKLPPGPRVRLGPDATGLGWVYMYTLEDTQGRYDLGELRALQDWFIAPILKSIDGVSEVASVGGAVRRFEITADPRRMLALGVDVGTIAMAVERANRDVGGMAVEIAEREFMVRGRGYLGSIRDLENVVLRQSGGTPLRVRDVAEVSIAPDSVRGIADRDGRGEAVAGIVVMRYGENAQRVIDAVRRSIEKQVKPGLPEGVVVRVAYDRSPLIRRAIATLTEAILQVMVIIALICFVFLLHIRSAFVAFVALPMSTLITFIAMQLLGLNANIMSLAGIAIGFGTMVDASIVMVENVHKKLERGFTGSRLELLYESCREVGGGLVTSLLVVAISNLPLFALQEQAGRLFIPLAWTNTLACGFSSILAITLIPPLLWLFVRGRLKRESEIPASNAIIRLYAPIVRFVVRHPWPVVIGSFALSVIALAPALRLGQEFMPPLEEGDLLYMPTSVPGIGTTEARRSLRVQDALLATFPEVQNVLGKIGRSTTATDTAPLEMVETTAMLTDEPTWPRRAIPKGWIARRIRGFRPDLAESAEAMTRATVNDRIRRELSDALWREKLSFREKDSRALLTPEEEARFEEVRPALQHQILQGLRPRIPGWIEEALAKDLTALMQPRGSPEEVRRWLSENPIGEPPLARVDFEELTREEMQRAISQPGMPNWFLMPIQTRIGMITTGMRGTLGIKVFGSDYARVEKMAVDLEQVLLNQVEGTVAAVAERVATGGYYLDVIVDREACARYGINVDDVQMVVATAIGGMQITETVEGRYRFPVVVRYPREERDDPERLGRILVRVPGGGTARMESMEVSSRPAVVTLGQLAKFELVRGPMEIKSENNLLVVYLPVEFEGVSLGGYVERAQRVIDREIREKKLEVPSGYTFRWSGQYEIMERANRQLGLLLGLTLAIIFVILYMHFRTLSNTLMVLLGTVFFAPVGAVWLTYLLGYNVSWAWWLGIILLLGLAAETGVIMLVYIENAVKERRDKHGKLTAELLEQAIEEGAIQRVRPKMMTVLADAIGLVPLLWVTGAGAGMLHRMAAPLIGGVISSLVLTLCIIPAAYRILFGFGLGRATKEER